MTMTVKKIYKCIECNYVGRHILKLHGAWHVLLSLGLLALTLVFFFPFVGIPLGIGIYFYFRRPHCSKCGSILVEPIIEVNDEFGVRTAEVELFNLKNDQQENSRNNLLEELEVNSYRGIEVSWDFLISELSEGQLRYNQLRGQFVNKSQLAALDFEMDYEREVKSLDQLVEISTSMAVAYILRAIDDAVQILISMNIYDVDRDLFLREYYQPYDYWFNAFDSIADKYSEIVFNAEQLDEYRTFRRKGRGQIIGGGFGVEGVVQGVAIAGAANLAIGAVHGIFNTIGKGFSSVGDSIKKNIIFSNPQTKNLLVEGLRRSVLCVHFSLLDVLKKYGNDSLYQAVDEDVIDKSKRMLNNLKVAEIGEEERLKILKQILLLNPYSEDVYEFAVEKFGDRDKKLESVAEFFFVNLKSIKHNKIRSQVTFSSVDSVRESIKRVRELEIFYESMEVDSILMDLRKKLVDYDIQARTVAGKLYSTQRMAELAIEKLTKDREEALLRFATLPRRLIVGVAKGGVVLFSIMAVVSLLIAIFSPAEEKAPPINDPHDSTIEMAIPVESA